MNSHRLKAYFQLLIVAVIWGIAGPVIKITLGQIPPDIFILYRFLISSIIALVYFLIKGISFPKDRESIIELLIYCLFNSSVQLGLLFWGTSRTSLLDMSLISLFGPLLLVAAGYIFLKDRITKREKTGTLIALIGASLIGIAPVLSASGDGQITGNILIFLSLIAGAVCGVLAKKLLRKGISPALLVNLSFIIGFITTLLFVIIKGGVGYSLSLLSNTNIWVWAGIIYMAIFSGNIAYILSVRAQKTIELSEVAPFAYLYPIFSAILAVAFLGDKITLPIAAGSVVTLLGVFIAESKRRK